MAFPSTCPNCGVPLRSKIQSSHHRRVCMVQMIERVASLVTAPVCLTVSRPAGPTGPELKVFRTGETFAVSVGAAAEEFADPKQAVTAFVAAVYSS